MDGSVPNVRLFNRKRQGSSGNKTIGVLPIDTPFSIHYDYFPRNNHYKRKACNMTHLAKVLLMLLFTLLICGVAVAQVTIDDAYRYIYCDNLGPVDPGIIFRFIGPDEGLWSRVETYEGVAAIGASQISEIQPSGSNLQVSGELGVDIFLDVPSEDENLQVGAAFNVTFTVSEASVLSFEGSLGENSFYFFGVFGGRFFYESESPGLISHSEVLAPGDQCFLNIGSGVLTPPPGTTTREGTADFLISVVPEGTVSAGAASWDEVKALYR